MFLLSRIASRIGHSTSISISSSRSPLLYYYSLPHKLSAASFSVWEKLSDDTRRLADRLLETVNDDEERDKRDSNKDEYHPWQLRLALSKAITLAESRNPIKQEQAALLLTHLLHDANAVKRRNSSFRLGIAGAPGAGKSTFIEALGNHVLELTEHDKNATDDNNNNVVCWKPHKVAVVCVDPSGKSGGSILGDKTRMTELSRHSRAYVRPAPASGALGGVATYTDDVVSLCQVANYPLVIVETVGLGQSEVEVEQTVDMLLLLVPPAGGDALQGVKKGIVEVANLLLVTKADGSLLSSAKKTAADYKGAMQFLHPFGPSTPLSGWAQPQVMLVSSVTKDGLAKVWQQVSQFRKEAIETGYLEAKRREQRRYWMWKNLQNLVKLETDRNPILQSKAKNLQHKLMSGCMTPRVAAAELLECLRQK